MIVYLLARGVVVLSGRLVERRNRRKRGEGRGGDDGGRGGRGGDDAELVLAA